MKTNFRSLLAAALGALSLACNETGSGSGNARGNDAFSVTAVTPGAAAEGETVTITGTGFEPDTAQMEVIFFDGVAATLTSATINQLVTTVPTGAATGPITVTNLITSESVTTAAFTVNTTATWTEQNYGSAFVLNAVADSGTTVVAVGFGNTIVSSANGTVWTPRAAPDANSSLLKSVLWDGAKFILVGDVLIGAPPGTLPLIATSPDGATWTRNTSWANGNGETVLADVAAAVGAVTAVGSNGTIIASANAGVDWVDQVTPALTGAVLAELKGVAAAGGTRVAVGRDGSFRGVIIASTNGTDWNVSAEALTTFFPYGVAASGTLFVAVGASDGNVGATPVVQTSPDGAAWTTRALPAGIATAALKLTDVHWDGTQFLAVGDDGATASTHVVISSADGITWNAEVAPPDSAGANALNGISSSPTLSVAVGDSLWTQ